MGEDHDARKRSKKRRKGAATIDRELAAEGGKRNRSKKNRIRRLCKGMCYQPPVVSHRPGICGVPLCGDVKHTRVLQLLSYRELIKRNVTISTDKHFTVY
jgi:hypothetical protein